MARTTIHVVQTFAETPEGLVAEEPFPLQSAAEARRWAEMVASGKAGVVAWSISGDAETGEWEDPIVLFRAGRTATNEAR